MNGSRHFAAGASFLLALLGAGCASTPAPDSAASSGDRPALAVLVVVDQLRADLLDRYGDLWTGGFKRIRENGHSFINASHDHAFTSTAPGHATLSTGVYPSRHGVIGNVWLERSGNQWVSVENIADSTVKIVGAPNEMGASPVHLMRSGLADWIVQANPAARIASVSGKDRGAIQPAAHAKSGYVYWYDGVVQRFVTSTYYRTADPDWVTQLNREVVEKHRGDSVWNLTVPPALRSRANRDTLAHEADGVFTYFPHRHSAEGNPSNYWLWWENTPFVDAVTLDMAERMVTALDLGKDNVPDFLNVSLSATDRIGHRFGPLSLEQMDNLLRLDRELGEFFDFLDATVGKDRWVMALSADHGVLDSPEDLVARGEFGQRITAAQTKTLDSLRARADSTPDKQAAARDLVTQLKKLSYVGDAWTHEDLARPQTDSFAVLQQHSMYPGRLGGRFSRQGVEYRLIPGIYGAPRGSGHGQMYWYDRHVPLIFMGPGISAGRDATRAATVDFAPTMASLLKVQYPTGLDGKVLDLRRD